MGMPQHELSSPAHPAPWYYPDDIDRDAWNDYELGGIALNDPSEGLMYQAWHLRWEDNDEIPEYGDFILTPLTTGAPVVVLNKPNVKQIGICFDQNMRPMIVWETEGGASWYWWYDSFIPGEVETQLPAGSSSPVCCMDDKREMQLDQNDMLLAYSRGGSVYYREQRDRFNIEYLLAAGVGGIEVGVIGMNEANRVQLYAGVGDQIPLSTIVRNICDSVGVFNVDVSELRQIYVRGFLAASQFSAAEALRALQRAYFFDMPDIDGELYCKLRGTDPVATIYLADMVKGEEVNYTSAREQEVEYPKKLHLSYQCAETDYTPTKATSERRSSTVKVRSETTIEVPVNFEPDEAAQVVDKMHRLAWTELEGKAEFAVGENFIFLTPADVIVVEIRPDVFKNMLIQRMDFVQGRVGIQCVVDRKSAYVSSDTGAPITPAEPPPSNLPGTTLFHAMDLPVLRAGQDTLHYYIAGTGDSEAWRGAYVQRLEGTDWIDEPGVIGQKTTMGELQEALPSRGSPGIDTTHTILVSASDDRLDTITQAEFDEGGNACLVNDEILQFRDVTPEGDFYRLSYLNRGQLETDPDGGAIGDRFVMLQNATRVGGDPSRIDTTLTLRCVSYGTTPADAPQITFDWGARSQTEWGPKALVGTLVDGDWQFTWNPNPRIGAPFDPVASQYFEGYTLRLVYGAENIELTTTGTSITFTNAEQLDKFGESVLAWNTVRIMGLNKYTGKGDATQL